MMKRNSTDSRKENGNVTVAADDLVQLLNTWTFDSSHDEEDLVVPNKNSSAAHLYICTIYYNNTARHYLAIVTHNWTN
jgi:hypothetical protein